jgi:hypothetical protein
MLGVFTPTCKHLVSGVLILDMDETIGNDLKIFIELVQLGSSGSDLMKG